MTADNDQRADPRATELAYPFFLKRMTSAYLAALAFSALVCVAGFAVLSQISAGSETAPAVVNISARQAMLLQRSATLAGELLNATTPQAQTRAREELEKARGLMLSSHTALTTGDPLLGLSRDLSDAIHRLHFSEPWNIDRKLRAYVALIDQMVTEIDSDRPAAELAYDKLHGMVEGDLLTSLNLAAAEHERQAVLKAEKVTLGHALWAACLLLALLIQAVFIFRPLARSIAERTSDLVEAKAKVEHASLHDMLTNLPNRRQCAEELEKAIASAARNKRRVAILHIDLDRFKAINDTFGHAVGDSVLVAAARRFERSVRRGDTIARLGGDEFVIIAPIESEPTEAARIGTRILKKMSRPIQCGSHTVTTGASVGISIYPDDEVDPEQLLINADIALYRAKEEGRGRVSFFSPEMRRDFEEREKIEADLRRAIANDEFEVHFQPQVRDDEDRVVGMEALVRWRHPEQGLISAEQFMPVAQSSGLIVPIGKRVIDHALAAAQSWTDKGFEYGVVSINVSSQQIRDDRFVEFLQERMDRYGVEPDKVAIEVVEAVLTDQRNESIGKMIDRLQHLGVTVELDDFGTGYAALSHLKRYKINRLKIDRTFVGAIGTEAQNVDLIKTLVDVARNFGIDILAEGVETEAQRTFLNALGCMQVQGYQVARPMAPDAATDWLAAREADLATPEVLESA